MQIWTLLISPTTSFLHSSNNHKRVLNFVQQVFFLLSMEGSLVIIRAYPALYIGGTPSQETGTRPPSCPLLENRLYMSKIKFNFFNCRQNSQQRLWFCKYLFKNIKCLFFTITLRYINNPCFHLLCYLTSKRCFPHHSLVKIIFGTFTSFLVKKKKNRR